MHAVSTSTSTTPMVVQLENYNNNTTAAAANNGKGTSNSTSTPNTEEHNNKALSFEPRRSKRKKIDSREETIVMEEPTSKRSKPDPTPKPNAPNPSSEMSLLSSSPQSTPSVTTSPSIVSDSSDSEDDDLVVIMTGKLTQTLPRKSSTCTAGGSLEESKTDGSGISAGMIIMAHLQGHPWWPARVIRRSSKRLFVYFYGPEREKWAWVSDRDAKHFNEQSAKLILSRFGSNSSSLSSAVIGGSKNVQKRNVQINNLKIATEEALADFRQQNPQLCGGSAIETNSMLNDSFNEDLCYLCGHGGLLILCDRCPNACHPECAGLERDNVPEGNWYCPQCTYQAALSIGEEPSLPKNKAASKKKISITTETKRRNISYNFERVSISWHGRARDALTRISKVQYWKALSATKSEFQVLTKKTTSASAIPIVLDRKRRRRNRQYSDDWATEDSSRGYNGTNSINASSRHKKSRNERAADQYIVLYNTSTSAEERRLYMGEMRGLLSPAEIDKRRIMGEIKNYLDESDDEMETELNLTEQEETIPDTDQYLHDLDTQFDIQFKDFVYNDEPAVLLAKQVENQLADENRARMQRVERERMELEQMKQERIEELKVQREKWFEDLQHEAQCMQEVQKKRRYNRIVADLSSDSGSPHRPDYATIAGGPVFSKAISKSHKFTVYYRVLDDEKVYSFQQEVDDSELKVIGLPGILRKLLDNALPSTKPDLSMSEIGIIRIYDPKRKGWTVLNNGAVFGLSEENSWRIKQNAQNEVNFMLWLQQRIY